MLRVVGYIDRRPAMIVGNRIDLDSIEKILFENELIEVSEEAAHTVSRSFRFLEKFAREKIIYGINTGFGPMAQYRVDDSSLTELQYNIIRSHATGAGAPLPCIYVKAAMLARLMTFLQGKSGVSPELVDEVVKFINLGIFPYIPEHGSVGASGDLVQLAHIALALIGEGEVFFKGQLSPAAEVLDSLGVKPFTIRIREGLSVTNGTSVMTGIGIVNLIYARRLFRTVLTASVLINEVASSYDDLMSEELNAAKLHEGQRKVAEMMRSDASGSRCLRKRTAELYSGKHTERQFGHKVQPYYSLRCVPQVLGPVYDELVNAGKVLVAEINSACDNPIVDPDTSNVYHGGNFHGDYVSFEMDKLKIAVTKMTMMCERQLNYLMHDKINGILPPFVNMGVLGLNYGMQAFQFTATSTTAECQTLSNPMYVHSIPNNNDNQDIVSMGTNSALIAAKVIDNAFQVTAIHLVSLAQAVDCLDIASGLSPVTHRLYSAVREIVPAFRDDRPRYREIEKVADYIRNSR